ncbi:mucin-6 [Eulemur rufifrons]|uniref:mucin-6 n=1 Tax=Eulemur rufifrons TaxID=859984 RepID=UPI0037441E7F
MGVGRRKLAPLWGLVLALACAQHTGHAQDGSSQRSYEHHADLTPVPWGPSDTLSRVMTFLPLKAVPVVRARNPAHNGRVCSAWGDFHYKTFDGAVFRFPGLCNYVLSAHCGAAYEDFNVQLRRDRESNATTLGRVTMKLDGLVVELTKSSVLVDGRPVQLPFSRSGVLVQSRGSHVRVVARLGLVFTWNQDDSLLLELDPKYANQTCGLCGDFNGRPAVGEFLAHNARLTPLEFGNLQKLDGPTEQCPDATPAAPENCSASVGICEELLGGRLLAGCAALVDVGSYVDACRQDLCLCQRADPLSCACDTLAEYSRQCAHAGGLPPDWRGPDLCPQTCPDNMQYHECRSPCADTCSNLEHSRACEDHCAAGCFCPEGTVLDDIGQTGCVPASQCACTYNGTTYAPGAAYATDCTNCTCSGGRWSCQEVPCPGTCSVLGGAHFSTFDERHYTVHGDCSYVLAKPCGSGSFTVLAELRPCGLTDSETCLRSVTLSLGGANTVVVVTASGDVLVNQIYTQLPVSAANVTIFRPSTFFIVAQTGLGLQLEVQLVPLMQLFVRLDPALRGRTCGLCGNFNQNQADDFTALSGLVEGTGAAFANTWKTQAACPNVRNSFEDPCSLSVENEKYAQHWCSQLTDTHGPFARCHAAVSPGTYHSNCLFDTCNCERTEDCLCAALSAYAHACAAKGITLHDWRDGVCATPTTTCPESMAYRYHVSTCQPTCRALSEGDVTCHVSFVPVDGCTCPEGTFLDDAGKCVEAAGCPCYHRGSVVPSGESVHDGGALCTCTRGALSCIGGPVLASVCTAPMVYVDCRNATNGAAGAGCQKSCHTLDMACYSSQCVPGCVCPDGLVADGEGGCVAAEDCPCVHNEASYPAGQTIRVGCNTCTCDRRLWRCTDEPCPATCTVYGDGHYLTFDGQRYSFNGDCEYTLVQDDCGGSGGAQEAFRVVTENVPCGTTGTTCSKAIKLFLGSYELKLSAGKVEVIGDGAGQEAPYSIRQMGVFLVVDTSVGLVLLWDRKTSISVQLSSELKGRVCGLCGNFDGNALNDFTTRSQSVAGNALEFGNSWKFSPNCPDALAPRDPCAANPHRKSWAQKQCSIINGATFAACHAHVEPAKYYEACVSDACACDSGGDCECFCTAVAAYAQACHHVGLCVAWRTPDVCPLFCDYYNPVGHCEWHYQPCGAPCLRTCRNPRGDCLHDARRLEGCYPTCPAEAPIFDEDKMQCVAKCPAPPPPPPCRVQGKSYQPGAPVPSDRNCQSCVCGASGVRCSYNASACVCTYDGRRFRPGDVIYHTTDGTGGCISAHCGANGTIQRSVHSCSPSSPPPPTTFSFSTAPRGVSSRPTPSPGLSTAHAGPPSSAQSTAAGTPPRTAPSSASVPPRRGCGEDCLWSPWLDVSRPGQGIDSGDFDTLENLRAHGYRVCLAPREVQCRAEDAPEVPLYMLGQRVDCSPALGLTCHNKDQASGLCDNYQIRVLCCTPLACPTSRSPTQTTATAQSRTAETQASGSPAPGSTAGPATLSTAATARTTVSATPAPGTSTAVLTPSLTPGPTALTRPVSPSGTSGATGEPPSPEPTQGCRREVCSWTAWIDGSYPSPEPNGGDFDTFQNLRAKGYKFCDRPRRVECRAQGFPDTPLAELGQDVTCNAKEGLLCLNRNQLPPICYNYEIRIQCCRLQDACRPGTTAPATAATTPPTPPETRTDTQATATTAVPVTPTRHTAVSSAAVATPARTGHSTHAVTTPQPRDCQPRCTWTKWFDVDYPAPGPDGGDVETYDHIISRGERICHRPADISGLECRAENHPDVGLEALGQAVRCSRDVGLVCRNRDQAGAQTCLNYQVRVLCCRTPDGCARTTVPVTVLSTLSESVTSRTDSTLSGQRTSTTLSPQTSTTSGPIASATSGPIASATAGPIASATAGPTASTSSGPITRCHLWSYSQHSLFTTNRHHLWSYSQNNLWSHCQCHHCSYSQHNLWSHCQCHLWSYSQHKLKSYNQDNLTFHSQHHLSCYLWSYKHYNLWSHCQCHLWSYSQHNLGSYNQDNLSFHGQHHISQHLQSCSEHNLWSYYQGNLWPYNQGNLSSYSQHNLLATNRHHLWSYNQHNIWSHCQCHLWSSSQHNLWSYNQGNLWSHTHQGNLWCHIQWHLWSYSQHILWSYNQGNLCSHTQWHLWAHSQHILWSYNQGNLWATSGPTASTTSLLQTSTTSGPTARTTSSLIASATTAPTASTTSGPIASATSGPTASTTSSPQTSTIYGPTISTTTGPIPSATSGPPASTSSGPITRATSGPTASTTSLLQTGTISGPTARTTSGPIASATSGPTASTSSGLITRTTSASTASTTSRHKLKTTLGPKTSTTSSPQTSSIYGPTISTTSGAIASATSGPPASTSSGPPASTSSGPITRATSGPIASTSSGPIASTTSGPITRATSGPPASATSGPITRTTSASTASTTSRHKLKTTLGPKTSTTSSPQTSSTSSLTASTISGPITKATSGPITKATSRPTASTTSSPQTGTIYGPTISTTSGPIASATSGPTASTSSSLITRTTSPSTASTISQHKLKTTLGPITSTTSSPQTSTTSGPIASATSGPTGSTTSGPIASATSGPPASTSSGPITRATSGPIPSSTSGPIASTISSPITRATSGPIPSVPSGPIASTTSGPITRATSGPIPSSTSGPIASTISGPITRATSGPIARRTSGPITMATSGPIPSSTSGPIASTTSGPITRATSGPISSGTSGPIASTISGPITRATSGPTASTTSLLQTGTTSGPTARTTSSLIASATTAPTASTTSGPIASATSGPTASTTSSPQTSTIYGPTISTTTGPIPSATSGPPASTSSGPITRATSGPTASTTSLLQTGTISGPTARTTSGPIASATSGPTASTSSGLITRTTSASTASTTSRHKLKTTLGPKTSTTSSPQTSSTSSLTASTISGPITKATSGPITKATSRPTASTTSSPQTSTISGPTISTTSGPIASATSGPTASTSSSLITRTTSPSTASTISQHKLKTTLGPITSTTSSPQTSTTSGPIATPSPVPTTSTTSAPLTSTVHVPTPWTTVLPSQPRDCQPRCAWTKWFDVDYPAPGPDGGDVETYDHIISRGESICHRPGDISGLECRAENHPDVGLEALGQAVRCSRDVGLVCRNRDQAGAQTCLNYRVRVLCCRTPDGCALSPVTPRTTPPAETSPAVLSSSAVSSSVAPSSPTCFCSVGDRLYPAGSVIYRQADLAGHCYYALCNRDCQVVRGVDSACPSTAPPLSPVTSPSTATSEPVPAEGCPHAVPPRKKGETWAMPNCSQATCEGGNVISLHPRPCPSVEKPTCANGYPALKVADQDGCCQHYQCQCVCSGWGDPHYITFDGTYYTFLDNCTYVLVQQIVPVYGHFRVLIDNYFCGAEDGLSCPKSIIVEHGRDRVVLTRRPVGGVMTNEVIFDDEVVSPGFRKNGIEVSRVGIKMYVTIPAIGVQVMFSGLIFSVEVPFSKFANNTEGQCGTCTNDQKDDCRLPGGAVATSCSKMSGLWNVTNPDQPSCHGPRRAPTTVGPPPPSATCPPSPLCQLILSKVFELCHAAIPPWPFYEGCVFDQCHATEPEVVCSGLELYASLCATYGVCIDWRGRTNHTCPLACPAGKVYQPCGPADPTYCYGNNSASPAVLQDVGAITEGCFCPQGMTLFSASTQACVPAGCPRCLGPRGEPMEPGQTVTVDCQECSCEGTAWTVTCRTKPCPLPPACPLPGLVPVPVAARAGQCCPQYRCACNASHCPRPTECPQGSHPTLTYEEGTCCPTQNCSWTVCSVNGTLYQPGAVVSSTLCETCRCEVAGGRQADTPVVTCETQICDTHCPTGFEYQARSGQCCGACVQVACVANSSGSPAHLFYPGETWSDPGNHCVTHECERSQDGLVVVTTRKACPPLSCALDQAQLGEDGCCRFCPQPSKEPPNPCPPCPSPGSTCAVHHKQQLIRQRDCSSAEPVRLAYCQGDCGDTGSLYSLEASALRHSCRCCQELRTSLRNVTLHCADGSRRAFRYTVVEECGCVGQRCPSPGDTSHAGELEPEGSEEEHSQETGGRSRRAGDH